MNIKLYNTDSDRRVVDKNINILLDMGGTLKEGCSIIDPVISVLMNFSGNVPNYAFIAEFGRYYFINDIEILKGGIVILSLHVDVLMSNKSAIYNGSGLIVKTEEPQHGGLPGDDIASFRNPSQNDGITTLSNTSTRIFSLHNPLGGIFGSGSGYTNGQFLLTVMG